jgi:hypothetical protein
LRRFPILSAFAPWFLALAAGLAGACSSADDGSTAETEQAASVGSCTSVNPFSKGEECKEYTGAGWTLDAAAKDCAEYILGAPGAFVAAARCSYPETVGTCTVTNEDLTDYVLVTPGADPAACEGAKMGCEVFAQGAFTPGPTCDGTVTTGGGGSGGGNVFTQPYLVCKDPLPGEPAGMGPNGQVCTWTLISACTEEGRHYEDYASCDDVRTQRPYYAVDPEGQTAADDPRLTDATYMAEVAWARSQVEASACVCCHSEDLTPNGASQWYLESPGVWLDSMSDSGLAMMAGLADSVALGAFPAEENNGFDRTALGVPTTDVPRMRALLLGEWARRGFTVEDAADIPPFGGPLVDQLNYVPAECADGQGVDAAGKVTWTGGDARYLYVLDAGAKNPGVPPNLDEPVGTRWLVEVPTKSEPFASGVEYGAPGGELVQRLPVSGAPAPLTSGESYYLYVLKDVGVPITRCLFVAP